MTYLELYLQRHSGADVDDLIKTLCPDWVLFDAVPFGITCPDGPKGLIACKQCWNRSVTWRDGDDTGGNQSQ